MTDKKFSLAAVDFCVGEKKLFLHEFLKDYERTFKATGISHVFKTSDHAYKLGVAAGLKAIESSGLRESDIGFLISVTQSPSRILPGDSVFIHRGLKLKPDVALFDINAGCSGFAQALFLAVKMVHAIGPGIIVCSDAYRGKLGQDDRATNAVFSDAGSAVIITAGGCLELLEATFMAETQDGPSFLQQESGGGLLKMNGPALWEFTRTQVVNQINQLVSKWGNVVGTVDRLYMHQASKLVVEGISSKLEDSFISIPQNYTRFGNTVSSSIPILISEDLGSLHRGTSLISGFGVGIISTCLLVRSDEP